jgi:hypothetical protein
MRAKIVNILNSLARKEGPVGIKSYAEAGDRTYVLQTEYSKFGHQTWLRYEATGDDQMFRIEIKHVFGQVDLRTDPETAAGQLLRMLAHNTGSFLNTTCFVGVESVGNEFYATLNSFHHFVTAWSDESIAEALSLHFFDLMTGLVVKDTALTLLKKMGD